MHISDESDRKREVFFRNVFKQHNGYVCIAHGSVDGNSKDREFRETFFKYPDEMPDMLRHINNVVGTNNVWFCPQLLSKRKRTKETVATTPVVWADLDTCNPEHLLVNPSILVESSPDRWQAYWHLDDTYEPEEVEDVARRIAYEHAKQGADRSGWDLTQLLRVPLTINFKYANKPVVAIRDIKRDRTGLSDFQALYEQITGYQYLDLPMPDASELPDNVEDLIAEERLRMSPMIWELFNTEPEHNDNWSEKLWRFQLLLFEAGFKAEQVFAICREAKCNKYKRDGRPESYLWKEVLRAHAKHQQNVNILAPKNYVEKPLVSDEERAQAEGQDTFIERYINWAKGLGDAAPQYHQAGAFMILSSLLSGHVRLPTSFGTIVPNLWFMILADTTLTRKSTAMDIAMDLVMEVDPDTLLATDGSLEGLLTSLSGRPGKPSVFLRDEFSGLLEQMSKKDYMAGMPELLTKLYDGKVQKRILRKEIVEVRDPCLLIFAGGIRNKITQILTFEQVSSGFMPRFIFITAESDITRVKPLGPPSEFTNNNRQAILDEMADLSAHYAQMQTLHLAGAGADIHRPRHWDAKLTPEAWFRYNQLETQMLDAGMHSQRPELMTPMNDRLSKSILKASVLIAASRKREETVLVEEQDIVQAAAYGDGWRSYAREILTEVGLSQGEKQLDLILQAINRTPGVSRSTLMQNYHLDSRTTNLVFETLEQRGLIEVRKLGRGQILFPNPAAPTLQPSGKE